jgi:hypothetical protein
MPTVRNQKGHAELKLTTREASEIEGTIATANFIAANFPGIPLGKLASDVAVNVAALRAELQNVDAWPTPVKRAVNS